MAAQTRSDSLADFERRNNRAGLLIRYARGRVANFGSRQIMTLSGGLLLWIMNGPIYGIGAMLIAVLGEAVDCLYLRGVERRLKQGAPLRREQSLSTVTAAVQALTISACIALSWFGPVTQQAPLFAVAFLVGAAINGGLVLPYHRGAGSVRLVIYAILPVVLFAISALRVGEPDARFAMDAAGTLMLGFMVFSFLDFGVSGFRRHLRNTREVIEKSAALKAVNRKLAAQQKEAHRLSLVARNANDSVLLLSREGTILWVNETFTRNTGFTPQEAYGKTPGQLLNAPDTDLTKVAELRDAIKRGVPFRCELLNQTKSGELIWVDTNQVPVIDEQGKVEMVVAVERDVTEAKQHQEEMALARLAAEEGARAKAEFLATMSHEIRTPLNGVIGMADLLAETGLSQDQGVYTDTIRSSAQALLTIINDVLDLSRLDARKMTLSPVDFSLSSCIEEPVRLLRPQCRNKGLALKLDFQGDGPDRLHGDDGRLRQVLLNLIGNAIKFTEEGQVAVRVINRAHEAGSDLTIEVEDTGIGIPEDKQELIFERFSQADASTTRQFGGTGLGLTISRMLIETMGGTISVRSAPGQGSCFRLHLLLPPAEQEVVSDLSAVPLSEAELHAALEGRRILAAEDAEVNRTLIRKYLKGFSVELSFAHDGRAAVDKTLEDRPDLVLMDMSMPELNGIEATRRIRAEADHQPVIIALTANAFDSDRAACLEAGMDGFLSKPVRRAELLSGMARQLRLRPGQPVH
ncbi:ATP-binding protein [Pseudodonghicola flavimaris]|uniref:histidine kinase n=1 Tax=Pseudodonghicola flavimaris TaxID=3050036 RepID=A0ABT7EWT5_9RHOB|nr:ATP-binding protein [Pseudodonghicola flavimaris]MDK3016808.1 ATP-binding protein [Pseudodonghicola flavimaris]